MTIKTVLVNDTPFEIRVCEGYAGVLRFLVMLPAGGKHTISSDANATYREYWLKVGRQLSNEYQELTLSSDDVSEFKEVRVIYALPDNVVSLVPISRHGKSISLDGLPASQVATALKIVKDKISPKFDAASRSCVDLKKLLIRVKICQKQCNHLVQTCVKGMENMTELYSRAAKDTFQIWRLYNTGRVNELYNHLDRLEYILRDSKDLLGACAKDLGRVALVVSMPMPPEKDMEVCSMFDLLFGELMWNLDLIEHVLQPTESVKLEWSPTVRRYALELSRKVDSVPVNSVTIKPENVRSLVHTDRKDLQLGLENGLIFFPNTSGTIGRFARLCLKPDHERILEDIIIKRCKVKMHFDQNPSMDFRSLSVDPECFRIDHLDLKFNRLLGVGSCKDTYEGEWCGQRVAIAIMRDFEFEDLQNEVKQLLGLQHPKVVSFFGWAYTDDAPAPIKKSEDVGECKGGYIVMEKMECDLDYLINTTLKSTTIQKDSGGPFSHSVGLDILLQIVEAMLHVQKHSVMHRDLKPGNFLVNSRSSPRFGADKYYDVKLIDFGSSKLLGEDKNTYNKGTSRYGAPEMMVGADRGNEEKGTYGGSVDVFSFAMTCYQVITGKEPFRRDSTAAARRKLQSGERPEIPGTVLTGFKELMEDCWASDPDSRPTFEKIQQRLWTIKKDLAVPNKF